MVDSLFSAGALSEEEKLFCARLSDLMRQAQGGRIRYTFFLNLREQQIARFFLKSRKWDSFCFFGGYPGAERQMLCLSGSVLPQKEQFPLRIFSVSYWRPAGEPILTHRDFLGSLMNLNLKRELIGDILIQEGQAVVICSSIAEKTILEEWVRVRKTAVKVSHSTADVQFSEPSFELLEGTVASLRLDAVLSLALRISREKAAGLVRAHLVQKNNAPCPSGSVGVQEGDKFSVRGYGKYEIEKINGASRKGRTFLTVRHYL